MAAPFFLVRNKFWVEMKKKDPKQFGLHIFFQKALLGCPVGS